MFPILSPINKLSFVPSVIFWRIWLFRVLAPHTACWDHPSVFFLDYVPILPYCTISHLGSKITNKFPAHFLLRAWPGSRWGLRLWSSQAQIDMLALHMTLGSSLPFTKPQFPVNYKNGDDMDPISWGCWSIRWENPVKHVHTIQNI